VDIYIWLLIIVLIALVVFGPVLERAGFSPLWSLLLIVPLINLIMVWVFSFMEWPAEKDKQ